ncbi:MAG TPA: hypothetical protein VN623_10495 [Hyphomicrobium sp.]|jgi:hypothetical protein|uniref:hypothetical protein n=1 Tax=Hyphomicrobium sp. TaxID=82 RepID=UPI002C0ABD5D|nr:hypothetical protein [Hyphomicrobium sp.]HXE02365.1 hypothetical protein [Hyphomicrobium sp.]
MKTKLLMCATVAAALAFGAGVANAGCVTKGAVATSSSADSAKWFALETMVQSVSWGLWPGFVANGDVAGYRVINKQYRCSPAGGMVTCHGRATFCTK